MKYLPLCPCAVALAKLVADARAKDPNAVVVFAKVQAVLDRGLIFGYSTGRRRPNVDTAAKLALAAPGILPADGWASVRAARPKPAPVKRRKAAASRAA